jgi:hypothetical protein
MKHVYIAAINFSGVGLFFEKDLRTNSLKVHVSNYSQVQANFKDRDKTMAENLQLSP